MLADVVLMASPAAPTGEFVAFTTGIDAGMMDPVDAEAVRTARIRAGLTQARLAALAGVGVTTVRDIEQGRVRRPRPETVRRLAAALANDVHLCVLGPLRVVRRDGSPIDVGPARQRAVLGLLAMSPGRAVRLESIIDMLWGPVPPASAVNAVQGYVSRLRRILGPGLLVTTPAGYLLRVRDDQLDLLAFRRLLAQARPRSAVDLYREAMAWWRDEPLTDVPLLRDHPETYALSAERVAATLEYADVAAVLGRHGEVLPLLRAITQADPTHEPAHARLMIALAGCGRRAAALRVFDGIRRRLADELGVDPDRELVAAHQQVLRHRPPASPTGVAAIRMADMADHYIAVGERLTAAVRRGPAPAIAWLDVERPWILTTLREAAVLPGGGASTAVRLARAMTDLFEIRGYVREGIVLNRVGAAVAGRLGDRRSEALLLMCLGHTYGRLGEFDAETRHSERALSLWRDLGDRFGESGALLARGIAYLHQHRLLSALRCFERSLRVRRDGIALTLLARAYRGLGDTGQAIAYGEQALDAARGFRWAEAYALGHLAESLRRAGQADQAIAHHRASLAIYQDFGDRFGQALQLWGLGARAQALTLLHDAGALPAGQLTSTAATPELITANL